MGVVFAPGVAIPLSAPQSEQFRIGGAQTTKVLFGLTKFLDIGPSVTFAYLPAVLADRTAGTIWGVGGGVRLKRPQDAETFFGISPWIDADLLFIQTGSVRRPGLDTAIGLSIPIGEARNFWIGPFVRYLQVTQPNRAGFDNRDARTLIVGLSFEASSGRKRAAEIQYIEREVERCPDPVVCPDAIVCPEVVDCPPAEVVTTYERVVVHPDKLEVKEKIFFAFDEAKLEPESRPVLDEVARALKERPDVRVQVEGHTDSSGRDAYNQTLSEERAKAVVDYLVSRGIDRKRLSYKGFGSRAPTNTNTTDFGREQNRRVDFTVNFIILDGAK